MVPHHSIVHGRTINKVPSWIYQNPPLARHGEQTVISASTKPKTYAEFGLRVKLHLRDEGPQKGCIVVAVKKVAEGKSAVYCPLPQKHDRTVAVLGECARGSCVQLGILRKLVLHWISSRACGRLLDGKRITSGVKSTSYSSNRS